MLNNLLQDYGPVISALRLKSMAFKGKHLVTKNFQITDNQILDQIDHYNYPGRNIPYKNETDWEDKVTKSRSIRGIIH